MEIIFRNLQISFEDYATMNLQYLVRKQKLRLILFPVFFLVAIFANFYNADNLVFAKGKTLLEIALLYAVGIAAIFGGVAFLTRRAWRKRYDNTQFLQSPVTYTFADEGIHIDSATSQGVTSWETVDTLLLMKELAILTTRNFTVYFLDFRYLEAPATKADFLTLLQQHNISIK